MRTRDKDEFFCSSFFISHILDFGEQEGVEREEKELFRGKKEKVEEKEKKSNGRKTNRKKRPSPTAPAILDKLPKKSYKGGQK